MKKYAFKQIKRLRFLKKENIEMKYSIYFKMNNNNKNF